mmetsp:Transcript_30498/g.65538  ORF Transcript_30498/g.65538 Transcript_30498/m.65538 type:complete len:263 (-) Transcript_30498:268-1056(-)
MSMFSVGPRTEPPDGMHRAVILGPPTRSRQPKPTSLISGHSTKSHALRLCLKRRWSPSIGDRVWTVAVKIVSPVGIHRHVLPCALKQPEVNLEARDAVALRAILELRNARTPRVEGHRMAPGAPLVAVGVVKPRLGSSHNVALSLDRAATQERLPVRLPRLHRKRRRHQQHLSAMHERQLLVDLRKSHVVADGDAELPRGALDRDELVTRNRLLALHQPHKRRIVQMDLPVGCADFAIGIDDDVRVVDTIVALALLLKSTER